MKFIVDAQLPPGLCIWLATRGHDATHVHEIGMAEASEVLRQHDTIDGLGDSIVQFIIKKINAVQGALYIVNDENPEAKLIEIRTSFAYGRKKYLKNSFRFAEGLIGQAAIEQGTIVRTEIPDDYVTITSGILGDQKPTCILIAPLIANEEVYGVLEFAGLQRFNPSQIKFTQELSQIMIDTSVLEDERFRSLKTFSRPISDVPLGRPDPFVPLNPSSNDLE